MTGGADVVVSPPTAKHIANLGRPQLAAASA
jgi:hypothetical protein